MKYSDIKKGQFFKEVAGNGNIWFKTEATAVVVKTTYQADIGFVLHKKESEGWFGVVELVDPKNIFIDPPVTLKDIKVGSRFLWVQEEFVKTREFGPKGRNAIRTRRTNQTHPGLYSVFPEDVEVLPIPDSFDASGDKKTPSEQEVKDFLREFEG